MNVDLIKRLRTACSPTFPLGLLFAEAADEIERLYRHQSLREEMKFKDSRDYQDGAASLEDFHNKGIYKK